MDGDHELFNESGNEKLEYEIQDLKINEPRRSPQVTHQSLQPFTNRSDLEVSRTSTVQTGFTYTTQTSVTNGFKASATAGLTIPIAKMEISVEVDTSKKESHGESKDRKLTESATMKIPPKSKVVNYCRTTKEIVHFTSLLRVSGHVGVYFGNKICNAFVSIPAKIKEKLLENPSQS